MRVEVDGVEVDRLEVDSSGITTAALRLAEQAGVLRQRRSTWDRLPDDLVDRALHAGAAAVSDLVCDVLELVAQDLELLSTKLRTAAAFYDATERAVRDTMAGRGAG